MIPYIGGKNKMADWIVPFIPKDIDTYVEVFGGAYWVYCKSDIYRNPKLKRIVYNDFNKFMQKTAPEGMTFDPDAKYKTTDDSGKSVEVGSFKRSGSPSITTAKSAVAAAGPKLRPGTTTVSSKPSKP